MRLKSVKVLTRTIDPLVWLQKVYQESRDHIQLISSLLVYQNIRSVLRKVYKVHHNFTDDRWNYFPKVGSKPLTTGRLVQRTDSQCLLRFLLTCACRD